MVQFCASLSYFGSFSIFMRLSDEALNDLRKVLYELGYSCELELASREDLEQLGMFLLNLTAAAIKTREKMRIIGQELPPSSFDEPNGHLIQGTFPGFD
jgi:hypothetical protein